MGGLVRCVVAYHALVAAVLAICLPVRHVIAKQARGKGLVWIGAVAGCISSVC
jgi:hypothetical protein